MTPREEKEHRFYNLQVASAMLTSAKSGVGNALHVEFDHGLKHDVALVAESLNVALDRVLKARDELDAELWPENV